MKPILSLISFLALIFSTTAQPRVSPDYTEINKEQFDKCNKVSYLVPNAQIKKHTGILRIPIAAKTAKIFKDDNSDKLPREFKYLGDVKGTKLSLVHQIDINSEVFYLIDRITGVVDTLIGEPVFAQNMKDFVCVYNPGTDEKQQIQVCELVNGSVKTRVYLNAIPGAVIEFVTCVNRNSFLAVDNDRYWRIHYRVSD